MVYTWLTSSPAEANASTSVQTRASMKRTGGPGGVPHECGNRVAGFVSGHGFSRAATHRRPKALATEALLNPPGLKPGPYSRSGQEIGANDREAQRCRTGAGGRRLERRDTGRQHREGCRIGDRTAWIGHRHAVLDRKS